MLRRLLDVDGTHLSNKYKGVLLTASGQDANFQVFPLAFVVVDSENDESWTWFFRIVQTLCADGDDLTIISDRCQSIYKAKGSAFPKANHAACIVHLERNIMSNFKSNCLAKLVVEAVFAYKVGEFNQVFQKICFENSNCAKYLEKIGVRHWARSSFQGNRYNLKTSNVAESLNNALRKGRRSPIVELLRFIQTTEAVYHHKLKKLCRKTKSTSRVAKSTVSAMSFEVIGIFGGRTLVHLDTMRCGCRAYDLLQISCGHALVAADFAGISYPRLVCMNFKSSSWLGTYQGVISPAADNMNLESSNEPVKLGLIQPKTKKPPGRERERRIPSQGKFKSTSSVPKTNPNKCGHCRHVGHNRVSCKKPI